MSYQLKGTIKVLNETQKVSEKFSKREFVITTVDDMYPQDVQFQAIQDKCTMLDGYNVGDTVEVSFNLRGREWINPEGQARYFNSLDAWRIEKAEEQQIEGVGTQEEDQDLPF